jgi:hypothetical protein
MWQGNKKKERKVPYLISRRHLFVRILCASPDQQTCPRDHTHTHLCIDIRYFLDGAALACASVFGGYDTAVSALTELLYKLVFRVDDKGRVQSGEGVPLHRGVCHVVQQGEGILVKSGGQRPGVLVVVVMNLKAEAPPYQGNGFDAI